MATTTNYGWTTPDDTALVKDGASAIRTLGSSIDTSVKSLNPGTTSGDIDYYTSSTAKARLAKGTAGQVLAMNSGATAPEWTTLSTGGMTLISTTTLSAGGITLSSIPSTYIHLQLVIRNFKPANDGDHIGLRINGDSTGSRYASMRLDGDVSGNNATSFGDSFFRISGNNDNSVATNLSVINLWDYTNTATWKFAKVESITVNQTTTTQFNPTNYFGVYNQIGAISSLTLFASSGNFTSGTVLLYGVK